jgi:hypothetical protein
MGSEIKGRADYFEPSDWNAACSMCGRKRKGSYLVRNWMGQWRCPEHNEARQPQDFVRGLQDIQTPPWVQEERDIDIQVCTFNGLSAVAGVAIAGCAIAGRSIWDQSFYPAVPAPPWQLTTDAGEEIETDSDRLLGSDA